MANEDDELVLLATDKKFKRIFKKATSELEKNKDDEYKYKIHISEVVPLLRSFIFVSKRIYDEAKAEGYKEGLAKQSNKMQKNKQNKLYWIWQNKNTDYDTYDGAIVCAENEEEARNTDLGSFEEYGSWVKPEDVHVEEIGIANDNIKKGIVLDSFNAG